MKKKKNKKNEKGFTLIELLAVITIMGILMLVAIPAISRTIENTRRDTFANTAQNYANSVRTMWLSDSFYCRTGSATAIPSTIPSGLGDGSYYVLINSEKQGDHAGTNNTTGYKPYPYLLQQGGTSSWAGRSVTGIVRITVEGSSAADGGSGAKYTFDVAMTDGVHGITSFVEESQLKRADVQTSGATAIITNPSNTTAKISVNSDLGVSADTIVQYLCEENS